VSLHLIVIIYPKIDVYQARQWFHFPMGEKREEEEKVAEIESEAIVW
jgi:hypothetical protein